MNQLLSKITQTAYDIQFMKKPKEKKSSAAWRLIKSFTFLSSQVK